MFRVKKAALCSHAELAQGLVNVLFHERLKKGFGIYLFSSRKSRASFDGEQRDLTTNYIAVECTIGKTNY